VNREHPDEPIVTTRDEVERTLLRLGFRLGGVDLEELHAMALSLQGLGARVRRTVDAGDDARSETATGEA
jgi:hypothetical protein